MVRDAQGNKKFLPHKRAPGWMTIVRKTRKYIEEGLEEFAKFDIRASVDFPYTLANIIVLASKAGELYSFSVFVF